MVNYPKQVLEQLMTLLQLYELPEEMTSVFRDVSHNDLATAVSQFLFHHGPKIGVRGWGDIIQGIRDGGVDAIWNCHVGEGSVRLGVQVKSHGDFERGKGESFRRAVLAQLTESRQMKLSALLLGLCADMTSSSQREMCRGLQADVGKMTDEYVTVVSPTKMAGIWKWSLGLQAEPLEQMRDAGYAWLTAIYDSLGNLNQNSWGKGTGGDWSHRRKTTVRVGETITISAVAVSAAVGDTQYRFSVQRSGRSFEIRQDWSTESTWTWGVAQADIGRNVAAMISVRRQKDYYQFDDADDYTYAVYDVLPAKRD